MATLASPFYQRTKRDTIRDVHTHRRTKRATQYEQTAAYRDAAARRFAPMTDAEQASADAIRLAIATWKSL